MENKRIVAIVLAAGQGKRMNSSVQKQYLLIDDKPVLYYSLQCFQNSDVDDIVLVVGKDEIEYVKREIIKEYSLTKVTHVVAGGNERYESVYNGLDSVEQADYVLIHDGARPFITQDIIKRSIEAVEQYGACTVGMPVKDTIKIVDDNCFGESTPNRNYLWQIQTPQSFKFDLIKDSYHEMMKSGDVNVTDDTMIVERFGNHGIKVIKGSYFNIKITTPDDMDIAEIFLKKSLTSEDIDDNITNVAGKSNDI